MKKLKSLIIFSLVLFSFLGDISSAIAADNILWLYKEISSITQTAGKSRYLATKEDCENDRTVYLKLKDAKIFNFQNNITECTSVQVDPMQRNMLITPKLIEGDYISKNNPNQNDEVIGVDPKKNENSLIDSEYKLLSPIAGFTKAPENVGDYLNKIFILAIGLCVALAVLMMIIAGVQYMGEESIFGKMNAKGQIKNALLGLLIALSAYALLNTIDPRLLGKGGVSINSVTLQIDPEIHGDNPHAPQNGKYCNGKYNENANWPSDEKERTLIKNAGIVINKNNCTKVGQSDCTSLSGLNTTSVIKLKKSCPSCEIVITGGTECWLHSQKTQHLPGNNIVDLRTTASLTSYVEKNNTPAQATGMNFPVFIKNSIKFMKEPSHYHIINW